MEMSVSHGVIHILDHEMPLSRYRSKADKDTSNVADRMLKDESDEIYIKKKVLFFFLSLNIEAK